MPWAIRAAREHGILDHPDEERRVHEQPVPRIGGVAIFASTVLAAGGVFLWDLYDPSVDLPLVPHLPGVVLGCVIVFVTGMVDDAKGVRPALKLLAQSVAAIAVVAYGFRISSLTVGDVFIDLGVFAIPITILWMVGMTNAFNLIDGVDGLAGTMALIGLASCVAIDLVVHESNVLVITYAMMGAMFAFLRFNRPPAKVFLGDSGSMLLGFWLSIRTVGAATGESGVTFALLPLFALAYPLVDTFVAMARRWLRGHPISRADGRHIHHQILALGLSPKRTVELVGLLFFCVALMGISIVFAPPRFTLALGAAGMVLAFAAFFYGVKWLRYNEFLEFGASIQSVLVNARSHVRNKVLAGDIAGRILKAKSAEEVRTLLADSAEELKLLEISVIPAAPHFHQPDKRQISPPSERPFRVDYPIAWDSDGHINEVVLRVWCERPSDKRHIGAERIATRLAMALEQWLNQNPGAFGGVTAVEHAAKRLSPMGTSRHDE